MFKSFWGFIYQKIFCVLLLLHSLRSPCKTLSSFRISFQASLFSAVFLQPLTPVFFRSFSASSRHLFQGFPVALLHFGILLQTFFTVLSSGIISTCHNNCNLPFMISEIISGSLYRFMNSWLVQILRMPFSFMWPNIFCNIFLSHIIAKVFSSLLLSVQTSKPYIDVCQLLSDK